jgi:hypothetical protein
MTDTDVEQVLHRRRALGVGGIGGREQRHFRHAKAVALSRLQPQHLVRWVSVLWHVRHSTRCRLSSRIPKSPTTVRLSIPRRRL